MQNRITALLIGGLLALVGCGAQPPQRVATHDTGPSETTTTNPTAEPIRWDSLGFGSWQGARTTNRGMDVLIVLIGGPEYDPDNPCSVAYHVRVAETATEVHVQLGESNPPDHRPAPPPGVAYGCSAMGYTRYVTVHLARPLGTRTVIEEEFHRTHAVFDGEALAEVTWLPDGWHAGLEGPRFAGDETASAWTRGFGPERPAATGNHCTPTDAGIVLTQQRATSQSPDPAANEDVHGVPATYSTDPRSGPHLRWIEHDWLYSVDSRSGCEGDTFPSKDTIMRFARSLAVH